MFDFFRDMSLELRGIDSDVERKEREKRKVEKRKAYIIFSPMMKTVIIIFGILYLVTAGTGISILKDVEGSLGYIMKYVVLSILACAGCTCMMIKNKKTEIAAIVLIGLFMVMNYLSIVL